MNLFPEHITESDIQKEVIEYLLENKFLVIRVNSFQGEIDKRYLRSYIIKNNNKSYGFPDILAIRDNKTYLIEVKKKSGKLSENQKEFTKLAESCNTNVFVVNSLEVLLELLK